MTLPFEKSPKSKCLHDLLNRGRVCSLEVALIRHYIFRDVALVSVAAFPLVARAVPGALLDSRVALAVTGMLLACDSWL